jgi:hypothetical protein
MFLAAKLNGLSVGGVKANALAKFFIFIFMLTNLFHSSFYWCSGVKELLGYTEFMYDLDAKKMMAINAVIAFGWAIGSLMILSKNNLWRWLTVIFSVAFLLLLYPDQIKSISHTGPLVQGTGNFLLINMLLVLINCLLLPQIRIEAKSRVD